MKIQVIGRGCTKCQRLTANIEQAARELGLAVEIEKVTELDRIVAFGVPMTPAFAVEGVVRSWGRVPTPEQIKALLAAAPQPGATDAP
jgi:small redox-active disulfide protein 2